VWLPAGSFEVKNAQWWLPGKHTPRMPEDWARQPFER
jgi:hypothetical protein